MMDMEFYIRFMESVMIAMIIDILPVPNELVRQKANIIREFLWINLRVKLYNEKSR